jgi:hypothetical protein
MTGFEYNVSAIDDAQEAVRDMSSYGSAMLLAGSSRINPVEISTSATPSTKIGGLEL